MTDTRLPDHFLTSPALDGLTSDAFRVYVNGLMWSVTHGTDGLLPAQAMRYLHPDGKRPDLYAELTAAGLWDHDDAGHHVPDFLTYQTPAEQVERARALTRERKRRQRHRDAVEDDAGPETAASRVTDRVTGDVTSKDRTETGQAAVKGTNYGSDAGSDPAPTPSPLRVVSDPPRDGDMCAEQVGRGRCTAPVAGRFGDRPFCADHLTQRAMAS